jgi:prefoldin beta subunit
MDLPKQIQDKLAQFQNVQNQLQVVSVQKQQLILQSAEVDNALEEIGKAGDRKIYKAAGPLFIETKKADSEKFLKETKDTASARIQILEKQEKKLSERFNELKKELETMLGGVQKPPTGG